MRLWSLHPRYLDAKGIVALWREALLAKKVLSSKTRGYQRHPQLIRFREHGQPLKAISYYLSVIWQEAHRRGYRFDGRKFRPAAGIKKIPVTRGQLTYECCRLCGKLRHRCPKKWRLVRRGEKLRAHPLFRVVSGSVAAWEKSGHAG